MTRAECEKKVLELLDQIDKVCGEYHKGLSVCMSANNGHLSAFALETEGNKTYYLLDAVRFRDGNLRMFDEDKNGTVYIRPDGSKY